MDFVLSYVMLRDYLSCSLCAMMYTMLCDLLGADGLQLLLGDVANLLVLWPRNRGIGWQADMSARHDRACLDLGEQAVVALLLLSLGYNSYY